MLFLSAKAFITTALLTLHEDLFHPHFTERQLRNVAKYVGHYENNAYLLPWKQERAQ